MKSQSSNKELLSTVGVITGTFFLLVFTYIFNLFWTYIPFLTDSFISILWLFNISILITIVTNILLLIIKIDFLKHLIKTAQNIFSLIILFALSTIFPFTFPYPIEIIFRIFLIICLFGTVIGTIVEFVKFFTSIGDTYKE